MGLPLDETPAFYPRPKATSAPKKSAGSGQAGSQVIMGPGGIELGHRGSDQVHQDLFINDLIQGCFLNLGILTSHIRLSKTCLGQVTIALLYRPQLTYMSSLASPKRRGGERAKPKAKRIQLSSKKARSWAVRQKFKSFKSRITLLIRFLKSVLTLKYPHLSFKFICIKAAHSLVDSKILNDSIKYSIAKNPKFFKPVLKRYLRLFKRCAMLQPFSHPTWLKAVKGVKPRKGPSKRSFFPPRVKILKLKRGLKLSTKTPKAK